MAEIGSNKKSVFGNVDTSLAFWARTASGIGQKFQNTSNNLATPRIIQETNFDYAMNKKHLRIISKFLSTDSTRYKLNLESFNIIGTGKCEALYTR